MSRGCFSIMKSSICLSMAVCKMYGFTRISAGPSCPKKTLHLVCMLNRVGQTILEAMQKLRDFEKAIREAYDSEADLVSGSSGRPASPSDQDHLKPEQNTCNPLRAWVLGLAKFSGESAASSLESYSSLIAVAKSLSSSLGLRLSLAHLLPTWACCQQKGTFGHSTHSELAETAPRKGPTCRRVCCRHPACWPGTCRWACSPPRPPARWWPGSRRRWLPAAAPCASAGTAALVEGVADHAGALAKAARHQLG